MALAYSQMTPLGAEAHDFELKGIDGRFHKLADYAESKFIVIVFMCNHCPYVQAIWDDLVKLADSVQPNLVQFLGINSNANPKYPEDSFEKMGEYAHAKNQKFPYLYDENQVVAKKYGAECTPDFFVYDESRKLAYRGAFDGLKNAVNSILQNQPINPEQKHSMGCSIKWN